MKVTRKSYLNVFLKEIFLFVRPPSYQKFTFVCFIVCFVCFSECSYKVLFNMLAEKCKILWEAKILTKLQEKITKLQK